MTDDLHGWLYWLCLRPRGQMQAALYSHHYKLFVSNDLQSPLNHGKPHSQSATSRICFDHFMGFPHRMIKRARAKAASSQRVVARKTESQASAQSIWFHPTFFDSGGTKIRVSFDVVMPTCWSSPSTQLMKISIGLFPRGFLRRFGFIFLKNIWIPLFGGIFKVLHVCWEFNQVSAEPQPSAVNVG